MRARHEGLGLKETKPTIGERITRVLVIATFFIGYGASSLVVMITYLIDPSATAIFTASHEFALTWWMLIFQISLMGIMAVSIFISARYVWKNLKILDKKE